MKLWLLLLSWSFFAHAGSPLERQSADRDALDALERWAIQAGGRVKPFDTFARESLELFVGRESFKDKSAVELVLSMVSEPQNWEAVEFLQIRHHKLKSELELSLDKKYFSPKEVSAHPKLMSLFTELDAKTKAQEKLDPYWQAVQRLGNQLGLLHEIVSGRALRFIPPTAEQSMKSDAWIDLSQLNEEQKLRFTLVAATFVAPEAGQRSRLATHVRGFKELARDQNQNLYPSDRILGLEVQLNELRPFRWAMGFALFSTILIALSFFRFASTLSGLAFVSFGISLVLQIYGMAARSWLAGRPPVSNMYESVIWVAFGAMAFGLVYELLYRKKVYLLGAGIFGVIGLLIADQVGLALGDGISPLEPVLRSNLWLTVHVLTITLSYAAFALALVFGNLALGSFVFRGRESQTFALKSLALHSYRVIQIGVVLLAAGTILGGVWADYSWGRFWGWDPKETWALIALLGYLALLHARFRGMVRPFGFLVGAIVAFLGVIMAWYGVNFVLGAGLHSYGFGSGGLSYMVTYVVGQLLFVMVAAYAKAKSSPGVAL